MQFKDEINCERIILSSEYRKIFRSSLILDTHFRDKNLEIYTYNNHT